MAYGRCISLRWSICSLEAVGTYRASYQKLPLGSPDPTSRFISTELGRVIIIRAYFHIFVFLFHINNLNNKNNYPTKRYKCFIFLNKCLLPNVSAILKCHEIPQIFKFLTFYLDWVTYLKKYY